MKIYIVVQCEDCEGGEVVFVSNDKDKVENFIKGHPLRCKVDYYDIQEWDII